jgi:hypothetical protein
MHKSENLGEKKNRTRSEREVYITSYFLWYISALTIQRDWSGFVALKVDCFSTTRVYLVARICVVCLELRKPGVITRQ